MFELEEVELEKKSCKITGLRSIAITYCDVLTISKTHYRRHVVHG